MWKLISYQRFMERMKEADEIKSDYELTGVHDLYEDSYTYFESGKPTVRIRQVLLQPTEYYEYEA